MSDFERELEEELHRVIDPMLGTTIPARRVAPSGGTMKGLLGGTGVAIGLKILTGIAAAAAAITVAGAGVEIATTGSLNPQDWGISTQVHTCQTTLRASGTRGIGACVSAIARHHGHGASSHASAARENGNGNANGHSNGNSKGKGNTNGKDNGKGHGKGSGNSGSGSSDATVPETEPSVIPDRTR